MLVLFTHKGIKESDQGNETKTEHSTKQKGFICAILWTLIASDAHKF